MFRKPVLLLNVITIHKIWLFIQNHYSILLEALMVYSEYSEMDFTPTIAQKCMYGRKIHSKFYNVPHILWSVFVIFPYRKSQYISKHMVRMA